MKRLIVLCLLLCSCVGLQQREREVRDGFIAAKPIVDAVDPLTGGVAGIAYTGLAALASTVFGVNRALLAKKRADAIKSIDANPDTPPAMYQANDNAAQKVIVQVVGVPKTEKTAV